MMETTDTSNGDTYPDEPENEADPRETVEKSPDTAPDAAANDTEDERLTAELIPEIEKMTLESFLRRQEIFIEKAREHRSNQIRRVRKGISRLYQTIHHPYQRPHDEDN